MVFEPFWEYQRLPVVFQALEGEAKVQTEKITMFEMKSLGEQRYVMVKWVFDFAQVMMIWRIMEKRFRYQILRWSF